MIPDAPLSLKEGGGWGALELAARYSYTDLNDKWTANTASAAEAGVNGGKQDHLHGRRQLLCERQYPPDVELHPCGYRSFDHRAASVANGAKIDAIAARFQVAGNRSDDRLSTI